MVTYDMAYTAEVSIVKLLVALKVKVWRLWCGGGDTLKVFVNILCSRPLIPIGRWRRCRSARPVPIALGCRSSPRRWRSAPPLCCWPSRCPAAWPPGWPEWALRPACWRWTSRGERQVWLQPMTALVLSRRACPPWVRWEFLSKFTLYLFSVSRGLLVR